MNLGIQKICVFGVATLGLLLSACRSPEKHVNIHLDGIRARWQTNLVRHENLPVRELDWFAALEELLANNRKLQQARVDYTNSVENYRQIIKELIPSLNARAGVQKKLASLNTLSVDDVTFSADSFFSIPGLVNYTARIYAGKLVMLRMRTAYELVEREQVIELYRLFNGLLDQQLNFERLTIQRANVSTMIAIDPFTGRMMQTELQMRETAEFKDEQSFQQHASELFGSSSYRWQLVTNGMPELHYHINPLPLDDTNRVAQLQMRLFALELEANQVTLTGIKMRYWPELNIFVTGPPIYQHVSGKAYWWDASQVRASADLYWQADTRGYISRQLKQTKRAQQLQRARFEQEGETLVERLLFTQQLMKNTQEELVRTEKEIQFLLAVPPAQNFLDVQKYAEDYRQLTQQQSRLRRELAEFNSLFWFMDEQAWPKLTKVPAP